MRTLRFRSVGFGVTSNLAVIHAIRGRPCLCIVRERVWSVSRCRTTDADWLSREALGGRIPPYA